MKIYSYTLCVGILELGVIFPSEFMNFISKKYLVNKVTLETIGLTHSEFDFIIIYLDKFDTDGLQIMSIIQNRYFPKFFNTTFFLLDSSTGYLENSSFYLSAYNIFKEPFSIDQVDNCIETFRKACDFSLVNKAGRSDYKVDLMFKFQTLVRSLINEDLELSVVTISKKLNISLATLQRRVKEYYGVTPIKYINEQKLLKAKSLLETGDYNICEASMIVGFSSMSYFAKCFFLFFGKHPSYYKKKSKRLQLMDLE